jgi:hemerythrin
MAQSITWTEGMSVGVPALDTDHKCLIKMIGLLDENDEDAWQHGFDPMLKALLLYSRFHFAREERVMQACKFPAARFHSSEHWSFVRHIQAIRRQEGADLEVKAPSRAVIRGLKDYLSNWLFHHILIQDMAFKPYVAEQDEIEAFARAAAPQFKSAQIAATLARA